MCFCFLTPRKNMMAFEPPVLPRGPYCRQTNQQSSCLQYPTHDLEDWAVFILLQRTVLSYKIVFVSMESFLNFIINKQNSVSKVFPHFTLSKLIVFCLFQILITYISGNDIWHSLLQLYDVHNHSEYLVYLCSLKFHNIQGRCYCCHIFQVDKLRPTDAK